MIKGRKPYFYCHKQLSGLWSGIR